MRPSITVGLVQQAWKSGRLSIFLRESQREIKRLWEESKPRSRKFVICAHRRMGKSTFGLMMLTEAAIRHPGFSGIFVAPVKVGLSDYIKPIISKVFKTCPPEWHPDLDSHMVLTFGTGSRIVFRGSNKDTYNNLRGNDFSLVFCDEIRGIDDAGELVDSVLMPAIFNQKGHIILSSTPAETEEHYFQEIQKEAEVGGWLVHWDIDKSAKWDPSDFKPEQIAEWKRETNSDEIWTREYMARFVRDSTKIIIPEWSDDQVQTIPHDEYFPHYHKYAALDSGVRDKTACIFGYYDFKRAKLIIESEFALKDAEVRTDRIAEKVKSTEQALGYQMVHDRQDARYRALQMHEKMWRRVADNNNLILVQDLDSLYSLDFFPTRKDELAAMINLVREWAKDGRIIVHPSCTELLGCLRNAIWDKNKKELSRSKVFGHFDALMALVYLVRNVDTNVNPIPKFFQKSWATHAGVPMDATNPQRAGDALARMFNQPTGRDEARKHFVRGTQ